MDIKKKFFIVRMVKHRKRLSRGDVDSLSLEVFKAKVDGGLSNVV